MNMATEVNAGNFAAEVSEAQGLVLLDFWGTNCQHCRALMPFVDALAEKYRGRVKIAKLESNKDNRQICVKMRVMTLPAFILFRDGQEASRVAGKDVEEDDITALLEHAL
jgi:thioredoxin 1